MAASCASVSSGEQQYSLRWNDFHSSILSSFRHLRDEEDFVDVTLACDSSSFTAHKVVLSACSPYFRRLLKANPCQHPIVILRDVASADMESLLRFMYHGEVHVGQEQLSAFLKTAQMLQVRGLADVNSGTTASKVPGPSTPVSGNNVSAPTTPRNPWQDNGRTDLNDSGLSPPPEKRPRSYSPPLSNHIETKSDLQESLLGQALEGGPTIHTSSSNNIQAQSTGEDSNSISDNEEDTSNNDSMLNSVKTEPSDLLNDSLEHHRSSFPAALLGLQGLMPGPSGIHAASQDPNYGSVLTAAAAASSTDADKLARLYSALRQQSQHQQQASSAADELRPVCRYCGRSYSSPSNLRQHVKNVHSNWPPQDTWPQCGVCGKRCKTKHYLINHQLQAHGIHQRPAGRRSIDILRVRATDPRPCPKCGKIYRSAHTLRTHLEDKHTICPGYRCVLCGTVAKSRNSLHSHMSRQHRGISTKDLPVLPMPSPFDPDLASRLLAKAGVKVSPAELRARASPTGPRRGDMRLEIPRPPGATSEAGSSLCGGDDPEDLTLPLSLRYGSPTPNNNTVITKIPLGSSPGGNPNHSSNGGGGGLAGGNHHHHQGVGNNRHLGAIAAKSLADSGLGSHREPQTAPFQHALAQHQHHQHATNSAIMDTFLRLIAENSGLDAAMNLSHEQAAAYAAAHAKMAQMSALDKLTARSAPESAYPVIGRDDGRSLVMHEERGMGSGATAGDSSAAEDDDFSDNDEPEMLKAEQ